MAPPIRRYAPLRAAFPYTGSKWNLTWEGRYPAPQYPIIIEPFAGSACYSRIYHWHEVILLDRNPTIASVWKLLQSIDTCVGELPDYFTHVPTHLDQSAQDLLGLWAACAVASPRRKMTPWATKYPKRFWNPDIKQRLVTEAPYIQHWNIGSGSYWTMPNIEATWFIDAPYQRKPGLYPCWKIDYQELRKWVLSRRGQVIVCEGGDADWLDFEPLAPGRIKTGRPKGEIGSDEVWWYRPGDKSS